MYLEAGSLRELLFRARSHRVVTTDNRVVLNDVAYMFKWRCSHLERHNLLSSTTVFAVTTLCRDSGNGKHDSRKTIKNLGRQLYVHTL